MSVVVKQNGDRAACESRFGRVCPAGEDDWHLRAEHYAGKLRSTEILKLLGQHVAAFKIRNDEDVGLASDGRNKFLDLRGLCADRSVEGQRAVENAAGDLAAVGHLAEG